MTVNFKTQDVNNGDMFYSDEGGLEMQERYINYRPGYWYEINAHHNNVSVNYYPVTSAIAIRDYYFGVGEHNQLTVMVDRTVGGSSLKPGCIELMHTRRLLFDDMTSNEIVLNETSDAPLTVYTVQLFDRRYEEPL